MRLLPPPTPARPTTTRFAVSAALAVALAATTLVAPGPSADATTSPTRSVAAASTAPAATRSANPRAGGCRRDTAADLRWVSWVYRTNAGFDPTMPVSARWLTDLVDGATYVEVARSIGRTEPAATQRVRTLYRLLLERDASDADAKAWTPTMAAHGSSYVATEFLASNETYQRGGATDAGWIDRAYRLVLGRAADEAGLSYWTGRLAAGTTRRNVAASLWASPGSLQRRTDRAYQLVLGRPGDPGGLTHWSATTAAGGDEAVVAALASTASGWARAQTTYGAPATGLPPLCPPVLRWMPPAGTIVRTLAPLASQGRLLATFTFDDGPHETWTPQILDILADKGVKATFFMVGNMVKRNPDLVRRIIAEGHHVAIHTMTHPNLLTLGRSSQYREISGAKDTVEAIAGPGSVRCFRPPYGNRNATTDSIAADLGLATIMWSRDGRDWDSPGVDHIVNENLSTRYDGGRAVLLLHDGGVQRAQTVAALPRLIDALRGQGYRFAQIC